MVRSPFVFHIAVQAGRRRCRKTISPIKLLLWVVLALFAASPVHGGNSFEALGEVVTYLLPATALGISAGLKDTDGIIQLGMSGALTVGVSYGLKAAVDETRPNGDSGSFPSTHTSVSFAAAEYMRKRYGNLAFGLPAYAAATLVAVSRVESKEHYVHDVLRGRGNRHCEQLHLYQTVQGLDRPAGSRVGLLWPPAESPLVKPGTRAHSLP